MSRYNKYIQNKSAQSQIVNLQNKIVSLETNLQDINEKFNKTRASVNVLKGRAQELEVQNTKYEQDYAQLKDQYVICFNQNEELKNRLRQFESETNKLKDEQMGSEKVLYNYLQRIEEILDQSNLDTVDKTALQNEVNRLRDQINSVYN